MKLIPPNITPGPWSAAPAMHNQDCGFRIHTPASAPYGMAHIYSPGADAEANARAIAATPDTLAALAFVAKYAAMKEAKGDPLPSQLTGAVRAALLKAGYTITE